MSHFVEYPNQIKVVQQSATKIIIENVSFRSHNGEHPSEIWLAKQSVTKMLVESLGHTVKHPSLTWIVQQSVTKIINTNVVFGSHRNVLHKS